MTPMVCWMDSGFSDVLMSYKSSVVSVIFCEDLRENIIESCRAQSGGWVFTKDLAFAKSL